MSDEPVMIGIKKRGGCLQSLFGLLTAFAVAALFYALFPNYRAVLYKNAATLYSETFPCSHPETYSLGAFDTRFNVTKEDFMAAADKAAAAWEAASGKDLFKRIDANGAITLNLTYDARQQATDTLRGLGVQIDRDQAGYDRLKSEHDALVASYEPREAAYASASVKHSTRVAAYDAEVSTWNDAGGAPREEYGRLQREAAAIDAEAHKLNAERDELNGMVEEINAGVAVINRLAASLNITASTYNGVSAERGEEFEEGLFTGTKAGGTIDIFEFDGQDRLVRLLMHEMGHALGLEHVEDPKAVMYRLNSSESAVFTDADTAELKRVCKL